MGATSPKPPRTVGSRSPAVTPSLADRRAGFAIPLFSLRGPRDSGIGEILDLIPTLHWAASFGQRIVQLLPINETAPGESSPYNALSAFAIDPVYISLSAVPHALEIPPSPATDGRLARDAIRTAKLRSLERAFESFRRGPHGALRRFGTFIEANRDWLDDYALYRALKDEYDGTPWEAWNALSRDRDSAALAQAATRLQSRIEFLRYVQWIAAEQWGRVRENAARYDVWLKGDVPFVISRDSADVWARQDEFDPHCSVGAPPDDFSRTGQSWGLPMYDWEQVRVTDFAWWRRRIRQACTLYDLFRIDHIIGFFRTYAIPHEAARERGFVPADEPAQQEQGEAFLSAVVSACDRALPVAEDLGSVPEWVRETLKRFGIPGYKVFRWERENDHYIDPRTYDAASIATTGTHDTDTLSSWWTDLSPDEREAVRDALRITGAVDQPTLTTPLLHQLLGRLYEAGSAFVIVPIQDLFGWDARINVPATPSEVNWNWRLPAPVRELANDPAVREATAALHRIVAAAGRGA